MTKLRSLCVYCGSSDRVEARFLEAAGGVGRLLGNAGIGLIYGGGRVGLMGRVADGAIEAGGRVTGIIPHLLHNREVAHPGLDELILVETMHERKMQMAERADAFVVLPGGFGTLDEMFEIVTWRQLGLHDKPIILVDLDGYWQPLLQMIDKIFAERFTDSAHRRLFQTVPDIDAILPALRLAQSSGNLLQSRWL